MTLKTASQPSAKINVHTSAMACSGSISVKSVKYHSK